MNGFYKLASGLLTQNRRMTAVSNNIANANTPGYKKESVSAASFGSMLVRRTGAEPMDLGRIGLMTMADGLDVWAGQGILEQTGQNLHFAIGGPGFFAVQTPQGQGYTRSGSFSLDEEGYLTLPGVGRMLGTAGEELYVGTDNFEVVGSGLLVSGGMPLGQLAVYEIEQGALVPVGNGVYTAGDAQLMANPDVRWQTLELSNVSAVEEMSAALALQRQMQSVAQALRIYDAVQSKSNDIGKL